MTTFKIATKWGSFEVHAEPDVKVSSLIRVLCSKHKANPKKFQLFYNNPEKRLSLLERGFLDKNTTFSETELKESDIVLMLEK